MIRMYGFMMLAEFGKPRASGDDPMMIVSSAMPST